MSKKRAFVRYTKSGKIVPGSLIITTNGGYPDKSSLWKEVNTDLCCNDLCSSCNKVTKILTVTNSNITSPYSVISVELSCKDPEIANIYLTNEYVGYITLEELFYYFSLSASDQMEIKIISETEISVTYCKPPGECTYTDPPCNGYTLTVFINGEVYASACGA